MAQMPRIPKAASENSQAALRNTLRAEAKRVRSEMPAPYRAHKSSEICKRLEESLTLTLGITSIDPSDALIAVYAAFPEEVDLHDFIEAAYRQGCRIAFPCMVRDARRSATSNTQQTMEMRQVNEMDFRGNRVPFLNNPLKRYNHNDEELDSFPYRAADELTMIVVPVVGFDAQGNRLGYGAGNYDRYLTQIPASCRVVGVAFSEQQVDPIPAEEHDIPLAIIAL